MRLRLEAQRQAPLAQRAPTSRATPPQLADASSKRVDEFFEHAGVSRRVDEPTRAVRRETSVDARGKREDVFALV